MVLIAVLIWGTLLFGLYETVHTLLFGFEEDGGQS